MTISIAIDTTGVMIASSGPRRLAPCREAMSRRTRAFNTRYWNTRGVAVA